jgi:hypothetical protein
MAPVSWKCLKYRRLKVGSLSLKNKRAPPPPGCFGKRGCKVLIIKGRRYFEQAKRLQATENTSVSVFSARPVRATADGLIGQVGNAQNESGEIGTRCMSNVMANFNKWISINNWT